MEGNKKTQKTRVLVTVQTESYSFARDLADFVGVVEYYGMIEDIFCRYVKDSFRCDWYDVKNLM